METPVTASVVVASHGRPLRLRWLLNALEEQTFPHAEWEIVLVHDYDAATARRVIERHPLYGAGVLRHIAIEPGTGSPAKQRNIGWRDARGELVAFTDDDCRPEPGWLSQLVRVAHGSPGQVVQGTVRADPYEKGVRRAPHVRTIWIEPVGPYAQTCNILYPRALIESLGGFDERAVAGEDVDMSLRARSAGRSIVAAPDAVVYHAVESHTLPGVIKQNLKWRYLAYLVSRHPEFRRQMPLRVFWDEEHMWTTLAMAGVAGARRNPWLAALAVPYVVRASRRRGPGLQERVTAVAEIPGQSARQVAEVLGMAAGGVRHRTLVL